MLSTVRLQLALSPVHKLHLKPLDGDNTFIHGDLHEDEYMLVGVDYPIPIRVCKFHKSPSYLLIEHGFLPAHGDQALFTLSLSNSFTALLIYVDDIILAGTCRSEFTETKTLLHSSLEDKDLGQLCFSWG